MTKHMSKKYSGSEKKPIDLNRRKSKKGNLELYQGFDLE